MHLHWLRDVQFPRMLRARQILPASPTLDLARVLSDEFQRTGLLAPLASGARVAVAVGSRGISQQSRILRAVIDCLRQAQLEPFIVPAMGSHGGATAEGQLRLLADYGMTPDSLGVPFEADMTADLVGSTDDGTSVFTSRAARQGAAILLVNRVKPHTDFGGTIGSGLLKMAVVGLGKHAGALAFHRTAQRIGHIHALESMARVALTRSRILGGVAILEDQRHQTARLEVVPGSELESAEPRLAAEAGRLMPRLPLAEMDVLVVDRIGKNLSGTGMDPNVIGRMIHGYSLIENELPANPRIRRIIVRDLTPESHGNATGIGMADFTTTRLVEALDPVATYTNALTALSLQGSKIPIHFATDRETLAAALFSLGRDNTREATVVRIADTLSLEDVQVSEACRPAITDPVWHLLEPSAPMTFDSAGNLAPLPLG